MNGNEALQLSLWAGHSPSVPGCNFFSPLFFPPFFGGALFFFLWTPAPSRLSTQQTGVFTRLGLVNSISCFFSIRSHGVSVSCVWSVFRESDKSTTNNAAWRPQSEGWAIQVADTLPSLQSDAKKSRGNIGKKRPQCSFPFVEALSPFLCLFYPFFPFFLVIFCSPQTIEIHAIDQGPRPHWAIFICKWACVRAPLDPTTHTQSQNNQIQVLIVSDFSFPYPLSS